MAKKTQHFSMIILLSCGEHIDIECSDADSWEEFYQDFIIHHQRGMYYIGNWCNVGATFHGTPIEYINMDLVIGAN